MDPNREPIHDVPASGPQGAPVVSRAEPVSGREPASGAEPASGSELATVEAPDARSSIAANDRGQEGDSGAAAPDDVEPEPFDPAETLSPAVRRLVRQYDLDITGIHGTGPAGKIRVGDVIGMLGGRGEAGGGRADTTSAAASLREPGRGPASADFRESNEHDDAAGPMTADTQSSREAEVFRRMPTTTVFDCDLSRVLSHRKRERRNETGTAVTSYFLLACADALRAVPEIAVPQHGGAPRLGVLLTSADGTERRTLVVAAAELDDALFIIDGQLRSAADDDLSGAQLLVHHYGASGSLLATPTEIGTGHAASLGIGRVRREIVVKAVDGEEAPRVAARCHVTLTFRPELVTLARANQFVATLVRVLEQWPAEPRSA
jgi:2-oxoglutarate dehydrogenase E2 component (dihydrolipoamide succinyltransferase)